MPPPPDRVCFDVVDDPRGSDLYPEEAPAFGKQTGAGDYVLPVMFLLASREMCQVYQQERLRAGKGYIRELFSFVFFTHRKLKYSPVLNP